MSAPAAPALVKFLLATLPPGRDGLFNPWRERCPLEHASNGPLRRCERLQRHLSCDARLVLVGEAPGYQGCRYSGVPFTSERQLLREAPGYIPRLERPAGRLSQRRLPFSEPSATLVWRALHALGLQESTVLWNALQMHPHRPGEPWSNRPPTPQELQQGQRALMLLREAFPRALFVPVGRRAEQALQAAGIDAAPYVRHPANGGAAAFASGLQRLRGRLAA